MSPIAPWPAWVRSMRQVIGAASSAQRAPSQRPPAWKSRPTAPSSTSAWKRCIAGMKRQLKSVIATRRARVAASTISRPSAAVMASGFSQSTWAPWPSARSAMSRWRWGGEATTTMSGLAWSSISSQRSKTAGTL